MVTAEFENTSLWNLKVKNIESTFFVFLTKFLWNFAEIFSSEMTINIFNYKIYFET